MEPGDGGPARPFQPGTWHKLCISVPRDGQRPLGHTPQDGVGRTRPSCRSHGATCCARTSPCPPPTTAPHTWHLVSRTAAPAGPCPARLRSFSIPGVPPAVIGGSFLLLLPSFHPTLRTRACRVPPSSSLGCYFIPSSYIFCRQPCYFLPCSGSFSFYPTSNPKGPDRCSRHGLASSRCFSSTRGEGCVFISGPSNALSPRASRERLPRPC